MLCYFALAVTNINSINSTNSINSISGCIICYLLLLSSSSQPLASTASAAASHATSHLQQPLNTLITLTLSMHSNTCWFNNYFSMLCIGLLIASRYQATVITVL